MERGYKRGIQWDMSSSYLPAYTRPRHTLEDIIHDDLPPVVRLAAQQSHPYLHQYQETCPQPTQQNYIPDDLTFRMRPNTESVVTRDYSRYQPAWSWTDFATQTRQGSPYSGRDSYARAADYSSTLYRPVFNQYLTSDYEPPSYKHYEPPSYKHHEPPSYKHYEPPSYKPKATLFPEREPSKERTPFFLQPILPKFGYNSNRRERDIPATISSRANTSFPFRKYRSDFVPFAPYKNLHDSAKYSPNPDWLSFRPWGYKFRKARYVYVPEEENSSKSVEIERIMREARLRELVKGVYSTSYSDAITSKVTGKLPDYKENTDDIIRNSARSMEAETAVTQGEIERRKPLTAAEKRKRNETLAIGISRTELLKNTDPSDTGKDVPKEDMLLTTKLENNASSFSESIKHPKDVTPLNIDPLPSTREPETASRNPMHPSYEPTAPPTKEITTPQKEPTPPLNNPTTPPKELTASTKESTLPVKEPSPPLKEPTPPPKEPTPPPKEPTPPPKETTPSPPPKEQTPPPKEPTSASVEQVLTFKEPTPDPKEPTPPKEHMPTPIETTPTTKECTPPPREPTPTSEENIDPIESTTTPEGSAELPTDNSLPSEDNVSIQQTQVPMEANLTTEEATFMSEETIPSSQDSSPILEESMHKDPKDSSPIPCDDVLHADGTTGMNGIISESTVYEESHYDEEDHFSVTNNGVPADDTDHTAIKPVEYEQLLPICGEPVQLGGVSEASNLDYGPLDDLNEPYINKNVLIEEVVGPDGEIIQSEYTIEEVEFDEEDEVEK